MQWIGWVNQTLSMYNKFSDSYAVIFMRRALALCSASLALHARENVGISDGV